VNVSAGGMDLIRAHEGCRLKAYRCPAGVWTIGYGHTGADVAEGQYITQDEAERILAADVAGFTRAVLSLVHVPINQNELDALVSFAFNVGEGNLRTSTLLRKLNAGDRAGAANEFQRWNKSAGRVLAGLVSRRSDEAELFRSGVA
jgi:lysozyme